LAILDIMIHTVADKRVSRAVGETMSEHSDDYPKGGLKSHKKWGGVLFKYYSNGFKAAFMS